MNVRDMAKKLGELDATHRSSEEAIASFILDYTWRRDRDHNVKFLTTVLQAYAKLLQDHGVKVGGDDTPRNGRLHSDGYIP